MTAGSAVRLGTERYEIRSMTREDPPEAFQAWTRDPAMMSPMNLPARTLTAAQIADYWGGFDNQSRYFLGIIEPTAKRHIGFWMIEANTLHRTATLHLAIDRTYQDQEAAMETGIAVLDWLFDVVRMEKLIVLTLAANRNVAHLMKLSGWREEAVLREEVRSLNGEGRLDQIRFALLPSEWRAFRPGLWERWTKRRERASVSASAQADPLD